MSGKIKGIVVYKSETGFTRRYGEWIAGELGCQAVALGKFRSDMAAEAGLVIFGGRLYAGKIDGLQNLRKRMEGSGAELVVFATGATPGEKTEIVEKIWKDNFSPGERERIPGFYFQAGLDYEKMGLLDRMLMGGLKKIMKGKTGEMEELAKAIQSSFDHSSRELIEPLVAYVRARMEA